MNLQKKKINNNRCLSCPFQVKKLQGLGTSGCSGFAYVSLKVKIITKIYKMLNTVNEASMLQGKNPPPLVKDLNYIWNSSWSWIIHRTVLYWHRNWTGRSHPPYCFKVKWKPMIKWDASGGEKIGNAHSEPIASDDVRDNVCLKQGCLKKLII